MTISRSVDVGLPGVSSFTAAHLLRTARLFASDPALHSLLDQAPIDPDSGRSWVRLDRTPHLELWLLAWPVGTSTGWHDHGTSSGAFVVADGTLTERFAERPAALDARELGTHAPITARWEHLDVGGGRGFGARHVHDVRNDGARPAISVHAYSPALGRMTRYEQRSGRLHVVSTTREGVDW